MLLMWMLSLSSEHVRMAVQQAYCMPLRDPTYSLVLQDAFMVNAAAHWCLEVHSNVPSDALKCLQGKTGCSWQER
jgi:hypothetical protein